MTRYYNKIEAAHKAEAVILTLLSVIFLPSAVSYLPTGDLPISDCIVPGSDVWPSINAGDRRTWTVYQISLCTEKE